MEWFIRGLCFAIGAFIGTGLTAILAKGSDSEDLTDAYMLGFEDGKKRAEDVTDDRK